MHGCMFIEHMIIAIYITLFSAFLLEYILAMHLYTSHDISSHIQKSVTRHLVSTSHQRALIKAVKADRQSDPCTAFLPQPTRGHMYCTLDTAQIQPPRVDRYS